MNTIVHEFKYDKNSYGDSIKKFYCALADSIISAFGHKNNIVNIEQIIYQPRVTIGDCTITCAYHNVRLEAEISPK